MYSLDEEREWKSSPLLPPSGAGREPVDALGGSMSEHSSHTHARPASPLAGQRERLAQARYQRDWSQQELADLLSTTPLNINRSERGLASPNPYFRPKLCTLFRLSELEPGLRPHPSLPLPSRQGR